MYSVCAVFGGIYILNQQLASFTMEEGRCTGVVTQDGQKFNSEWIISGLDYLNKQWLPNKNEYEWVKTMDEDDTFISNPYA